MPAVDRKSTRLNSSHANISYAVFCLKKKKKKNNEYQYNNKKKQHKKNIKQIQINIYVLIFVLFSVFICYLNFINFFFFFFFFNDTATTEIYTLSLHDALPIWTVSFPGRRAWHRWRRCDASFHR